MERVYHIDDDQIDWLEPELFGDRVGYSNRDIAENIYIQEFIRQNEELFEYSALNDAMLIKTFWRY